jgi:hypothetical protein
MKFLLKLKHWQLFLLTWGPSLLMNVYSIVDPFVLFRLFPLMMLFFIAGVFGWIWAIGNELFKLLPNKLNQNIVTFRVFLLLPVVYMLLILLALNTTLLSGPDNVMESVGLAVVVPVILVLHLGSMVLIFLALRFAAKIMKTVELGRLAKFSDYAGEFFLIWFSPIGIWILQPRLNKLVADNEQTVAQG